MAFLVDEGQMLESAKDGHAILLGEEGVDCMK